MAHLNVKDRVIEAKIVYFGAGLSGKTTNLEQIKKLADGGKCGELVSLDTDGDRTLFFDWLPFDIGKVNGCDVKMQLYTVPGQPQYAETRRKVLAGSDGVVLVLDSQTGALEKNREVMKDLRESLVANGLSFETMAFVLQLNKRDLPTAMAPADLLEAVGMPDAPYLEAVASTGKGVFETLREATRQVLAQVRDAARDRRSDLRVGEDAGLDGHRLYNALTGHSSLPGRAAPTVVPKAAPMDTNGVVKVGSAQLPAPAPPAPTPQRAASVDPARVSVAARETSKESVAAKPRETSGTPGSGTSGAPSASSSQLGEVIASNRALSRRLDQLERSMEQAISQALRGVEAAVVEKTVDKVGEANDGLRVSLTHELEGLGRGQDSLKNLFQALKVQLGALHGTLDQKLEGYERSGESRSVTLGAISGQLGHIEAELSSLTGRLAALDEVSTKLALLDDVAAKVTALGRLEARIGQLATLESKISASTAGMDQRLDVLDGKLSAVAADLAHIQDMRTRLESIDRKLLVVGAVEKRLEGLERDRVTPQTLDSRLGAMAKLLSEHVDSTVDRHLGREREEAKRERASLMDAVRGLGKMVVDGSAGLVTRIDSLVTTVAQGEQRLARVEARLDAESRRAEQAEARIETLAEPLARIHEGVKTIDGRMAERINGATKAVDNVWNQSHGQFKLVGDKLTEIGISLRKMNDEMALKKGWFR